MEKTTSRQRWVALLAEQAQSGQSKKDFCAQREINQATFYYWQRRLKEALTSTQEGFVQLQATDSPELTLCLEQGELRVSSESLETLAGLVKQLCYA
jgi:transposase-like protein